MAYRILSVIALIAIATVGAPGSAEPKGKGAPIKDVLDACDRMAEAKRGSCGYTVGPTGVDGCTAKGCFYCPIDGSRTCYSARRSVRKNEFLIGGIRLKEGSMRR